MTLVGKRIVITRPPDQASDFIAELQARGAVPVMLPLIKIQPPTDPGPLDQALNHIEQYDLIIFTSANTVTSVCQRVTKPPTNWPSIAAIGPATTRALEACDLPVTLTAEKHTAEGLFEALNAQIDLRGKRVLLPQSAIARPVLTQLLQEAGALVDAVTAYETVRPDSDPGLLVEPFDAITFTSSSTVQNFVDLFVDPTAVIGNALVATIGPVTADTARDLGLQVDVMADPHTVEGLIMALAEAFERNTVT